jgi:hypothetical protein
MHKRVMISIDEAVYEGLVSVVGLRKIGRFLDEDLPHSHLVNDDMTSGYQAMAAYSFSFPF